MRDCRKLLIEELYDLYPLHYYYGEQIKEGDVVGSVARMAAELCMYRYNGLTCHILLDKK
jgi:hypothetical protein